MQEATIQDTGNRRLRARDRFRVGFWLGNIFLRVGWQLWRRSF